MNRILYSPRLPQMVDGVINQDDLSQDTIFVTILLYATAQRGDSVYCYFEGQPVQTKIVNDLDIFPLVFEYPAENINDGIFNVYYKVKDAQDNWSTSQSTQAVVDKGGSGTLPPPVFIDKDVNQVIDAGNVLVNKGTHIQIPAYDGMMEEDEVAVSFYIKDENGTIVEASSYTANIEINSSNVGTPLNHLIPLHCIFTVNSGNCYCKYFLRRVNQSELETSLIGVAKLALSEERLLPGPVFLDADDETLHESDVVDGVRIQIRYPTIQINDQVTIYLQGYDAQGTAIEQAYLTQHITITESLFAQGYVNTIFERMVADLSNHGTIDCLYSVSSQSVDYYSGVTTSYVFLEQETLLPGPVFPQAEGGVIFVDEVENENYVLIQIAYPGMASGDRVTVFTSGHTVDGESVPDAASGTNVTVTEENLLSGYINLQLPLSSLLAVGDSGGFIAWYQVLATDSAVKNSASQEVTLEMNTVPSGIKVYLTTGAPPTDTSVINVLPYNQGIVTAPAGSRIRISCDNNAKFAESNSSIYEFTIGITGQAGFRLWNTRTGLVNINVTNLDNPSQSTSMFTEFLDYKFGTGDISLISHTTRAPANSITPCSIYLSASPLLSEEREITKVRVMITDSESARIVGYIAQVADIMLNSDKSAAIDIINTNAEAVTVSISLPESSGSSQYITLNYVSVT